ncbi:hypothetical protein LCGC14_0466790 [marine sediment metagenome]|uniref:Uncharacterized protein n=1 Tax=marine sediment metagenome TaxID=412755 RepID=A0A0F9SIM5_9ZZZZ
MLNKHQRELPPPVKLLPPGEEGLYACVAVFSTLEENPPRCGKLASYYDEYGNPLCVSCAKPD